MTYIGDVLGVLGLCSTTVGLYLISPRLIGSWVRDYLKYRGPTTTNINWNPRITLETEKK